MARWKLKKLSDRHKAVARELVKGTPEESILKSFRIRRESLYVWGKDPLFSAYKNSLEQQAIAETKQEVAEVVDIDPLKKIKDTYAFKLLKKMVKVAGVMSEGSVVKDRNMNISQKIQLAKLEAETASTVLSKLGYGAVNTNKNLNVTFLIEADRLKGLDGEGQTA